MAKPPFDTSKIIRCGTTEYMNKLKAADPSLAGRLNDYESKLQDSIKASNPADDDTICYDNNRGEVIRLPYQGVVREWRLYSSDGGKYCYRVIKPSGQ